MAAMCYSGSRTCAAVRRAVVERVSWLPAVIVGVHLARPPTWEARPH
jgi:hypothetical protein